MNFKCPFCERTFSLRSAYSQHIQLCLKKAEIESDFNFKEQDSNNEINFMEDIIPNINDENYFNVRFIKFIKSKVVFCLQFTFNNKFLDGR